MSNCRAAEESRRIEDRRRASIAVCWFAIDEADAREMLDALGLLPHSGDRKFAGYHVCGLKKYVPV